MYLAKKLLFPNYFKFILLFIMAINLSLRADDLSEAEVDALIKKLGDKEYKVRKEANLKLSLQGKKL